MTRNIFFVAIGGMLGSVGRFLVVSLIASFLPYSFPFGTFFVNVIGCFVMGAAVGAADRHEWFYEEWRISSQPVSAAGSRPSPHLPWKTLGSCWTSTTEHLRSTVSRVFWSALPQDSSAY